MLVPKILMLVIAVIYSSVGLSGRLFDRLVRPGMVRQFELERQTRKLVRLRPRQRQPERDFVIARVILAGTGLLLVALVLGWIAGW